jgi:3-oxocholest-4-en-26-oyl-CoA dehydrogenase alpha subunit
MEFRLSKEDEIFREEVRKFLAKEVSPELVDEYNFRMMGRPAYTPLFWELFRKLGKKGWLGLALPKEYGGAGETFMKRFILLDEMDYLRVSMIPPSTNVIAPVLLSHGSEEQKREFLPRICRGEIEFNLGYTEPGAGSDLSNIQTRAVEDGDYFVVNGQKVFNSFAKTCHYHWLVVRTGNPGDPGRKALSILIIDAKTPGISIRPMYAMARHITYEVFFDNVRVPKKNLVGQKNQAFQYVVEGVELERVWFVGGVRRTVEELVAYAKETEQYSNPLIRQKLAEMQILVKVGYLLGYRAVWMQDKGKMPTYEAGMFKLFATELEQRVANVGMQLLGLKGQLEEGSKWAPLQGEIEHLYEGSPASTIWGGTSEVNRNFIALVGLRLPRG